MQNRAARARKMQSTASNRVFGIGSSPPMLVALARMSEGPYRRRDLIVSFSSPLPSGRSGRPYPPVYFYLYIWYDWGNMVPLTPLAPLAPSEQAGYMYTYEYSNTLIPIPNPGRSQRLVRSPKRGLYRSSDTLARMAERGRLRNTTRYQSIFSSYT